MWRKLKYVMWLSILLVGQSWAGVCQMPALSFEPSILGVAYSEERQKIQYCEWHSAVRDETQKEVIYAAVDGSIIAKKSVDYQNTLTRPTFLQVDFRDGERRSARYNAEQDSWLLEYQKDNKTPLDKVALASEEVDVLGEGFVWAVRNHWDRLIAGEPVLVNFGSTVHQRKLALRVRKRTSDQCGVSVGTLQQCFWVEPANAFLRLFVGRLTLVFNESQQLDQYVGVTNIQDETGKSQTLSIRYQYAQSLSAQEH